LDQFQKFCFGVASVKQAIHYFLRVFMTTREFCKKPYFELEPSAPKKPPKTAITISYLYWRSSAGRHGLFASRFPIRSGS